jgi:hypothetical protein
MILTKSLARKYVLPFESCLVRAGRRAEVDRIVRP